MKKPKIYRVSLMPFLAVALTFIIVMGWGLIRAEAAHTPKAGGLLPFSFGQLAAAPNDPCTGCHTLQDFVTQKYDHAGADFALVGMHTGVSCANCHTGKPTVLKGLPLDCFGCHAADDHHNGANGTNCAQCHSPTGWQNVANFDHNTASFKLTGAHVSVPCTSCHVNGVYKGTPTTCYACHANQDAHGGHNGTDCQDCHNTSSWDEADD